MAKKQCDKKMAKYDEKWQKRGCGLAAPERASL